MRAQWLHMKPRRKYRIGLFVVVSVVVVALVVGVLGSISSGDFRALFMILFLSILVVAAFARRRSRFCQIYRNQPSLQGRHRYVFSDDKITAESPHGRGEVSWRAFTKWRENEHVLLLYQADNLFHLIPKRWFEDASISVDELRSLLQRHSIQFVD